MLNQVSLFELHGEFILTAGGMVADLPITNLRAHGLKLTIFGWNHVLSKQRAIQDNFGGGGTNSFIDVSPSGMVLWLIPGFPHHQHHLSGAETWNCGKFQVTLLHTFLWDRAWAMSLKLSILKGAASSSPTRRGFVGFLGSKKIQQSKNKSVSGYLRSSRNRRKKHIGKMGDTKIPRYTRITAWNFLRCSYPGSWIGRSVSKYFTLPNCLT